MYLILILNLIHIWHPPTLRVIFCALIVSCLLWMILRPKTTSDIFLSDTSSPSTVTKCKDVELASGSPVSNWSIWEVLWNLSVIPSLFLI